MGHQLQIGFSSASSAIDALEIARDRLVEDGITVAVALCKAHGDCTAQDVWARMDADGLLSESDKKINARWLGAVFVGKKGRATFVASGFRKTGNAERNAHAAPRTVWRLR